MFGKRKQHRSKKPSKKVVAIAVAMKMKGRRDPSWYGATAAHKRASKKGHRAHGGKMTHAHKYGYPKMGRDPKLVDEHAKTELDLYMDNDAGLYQRKQSFLKNVHTKMKRGTYDPGQAPKLWAYWVKEGAKKFTKEFGTAFSKATIEALAKEVAKHEHDKIQRGEYAPEFPAVHGQTRHDPASKGKKTRYEALHEEAKSRGYYVARWSPGDGVTRYRFFQNPGNNYFGPENGVYTALGLKEAYEFLRGKKGHSSNDPAWYGQPRRHAKAAKLGHARRKRSGRAKKAR